MKSLLKSGIKLIWNTRIGKFVHKNGLNLFFPGSAIYWENRYRKNGNSGNGSYGKNADYKAAFLNQFVAENNICTITEFGCGDGNQLKHFRFPSYVGLDVAATAIQKCKEIFENDLAKRFYLYNPGKGPATIPDLYSELSLSLDVIYHLIEDDIFNSYMHDLFSASSRYVIIYSWDVEEGKKYHVRNRNFSKWINENINGFKLKETVKCNPSENFCDFFIYEKDYE